MLNIASDQYITLVSGIGIARGQYYWILGALLGIVLTLKTVMLVLGLSLKAKFCGLGLAIGWPWP